MTFVKTNSPMSRSIDGLFRDFFNEFPSAVSKAVREDVLFHPPVNIHEQEDRYCLELLVPGFEKTDFEISIDAKVLTIQAGHKVENVSGKMIRKEFSSKGFKRSFTLDEKIDSESIDASYLNGILTIMLPKKQEQMKITKSISVK